MAIFAHSRIEYDLQRSVQIKKNCCTAAFKRAAGLIHLTLNGLAIRCGRHGASQGVLDTGIHAGLHARECVLYPTCLSPFSLFSKSLKESITLYIYIKVQSVFYKTLSVRTKQEWTIKGSLLWNYICVKPYIHWLQRQCLSFWRYLLSYHFKFTDVQCL